MAESSTQHRPLPDAWVSKIFQELQGNYGSRFFNQWKSGQVLSDGTDAGVKNAMDTWSRKLGGFADIPEVFKSVLSNLPVEPPSLPQFVELCREAGRRVNREKVAIDYKPTMEEQLAAAALIRKASESINRAPSHDYKAWAKKLKARDEAGEPLSIVQKQAYKEALAGDEQQDDIELAA